MTDCERRSESTDPGEPQPPLTASASTFRARPRRSGRHAAPGSTGCWVGWLGGQHRGDGTGGDGRARDGARCGSSPFAIGCGAAVSSRCHLPAGPHRSQCQQRTRYRHNWVWKRRTSLKVLHVALTPKGLGTEGASATAMKSQPKEPSAEPQPAGALLEGGGEEARGRRAGKCVKPCLLA